MTVVHISLKLPLVQWAISLVLDLIFRCIETHWMYKYHGAAGSNTVHHGKWEGSGVLSLWLSHQSFQGGALSKELWGCSGHFHLTGPASHCHLCLTFLKILLFLHLFCFPFRGPASLHPVSFSFLSPYACRSFQSFRWPGSRLRDLGRAWRRPPPPPTFSAPLLAPSTDLGPSGFLVHLPRVGMILCARPRLAAHLLGQVRGIEVRNRALTERGSCLSPLF